MKINIKGYITHKESEQYADCADRYAVKTETNRFAIADGVSHSFFPAKWAELLVQKFVELQGDTEFNYKTCQQEWLNFVTGIVQKPETKWFTKNQFAKQESGLATFVGLRFDAENKKWFASALGDSFLFFISKGSENDFEKWEKLSSKPEPVIFDSYPDFFSSRREAKGEAKNIDGELSEGTFYLMTDALSEWVYIQQKEKSFEYIKENWTSQENFERSISELRKLGMGNDDSAVLIIELQNDEKSKLTYASIEIQDIQPLIEKEKEELDRKAKEDAKKEKEKPIQFSTETPKKPIQKENGNTKNFSKKEQDAINGVFSKNWKGKLTKLSKDGVEKVLKELRDKLKKTFEEYGISFEN